MPSKSRIVEPVIVFAAVAVFLSIAGCARSQSSNTAQNAAPPAVKPANTTADDLKKLRWIEGTWRGTGDVETPFYERYHFENDTLVVEGLADESVSKVTETTRFELKDGQFGNGGDIRWAATELTDDHITFSPIARAKNTFRWQKESADSWKAILSWPASEKSPAKERIYRMQRWPPAEH